MDANDARKMNELAETLKKHGLAASNADAMRLATSVENNQEKNNDVHKKAFGDDLAIKSSPTEGLRNQGDNMAQDTLSKTQIIDVLQQFSDKFCSEINKINEKLESMESMMGSMQEKPMQQEQQSPEPTLQELHAEPEPAPEPQVEAEPEVESEPVAEPAPASQKPRNPQDDMVGSVDLSDTFNVSR